MGVAQRLSSAPGRGEVIEGNRVQDSAGAIEPRDVRPAERPARSRRARFWPEVSGALALGLCVLAAVVLGLQVVALVRGVPGPGLLAVGGHVLAAGVAVLAQRFADRLGGRAGVAAVLGVLAIAGFTLWFFWWA